MVYRDEVYHSRIHRLPSEILTLIFRFVVDSDLDTWGFVIPSGTTAPLVLAQVCSVWRRLAISYPNLWTSISLVSRGERSRTFNEDILNLFIHRSGKTLPFSFALYYDRPFESFRAHRLSVDHLDNKRYVDGVSALARRLIQTRHRWRRLVINVLVLEALETFFSPPSQHGEAGVEMPMLEELSVSTKYTEFSGPHLTLPLRLCLQLRTVRILTPMAFFDPCKPRMEHLTTLELNFCNSQRDTLAWLTCCPNLESLSIEFFAPTNDGPIEIQPGRIIRLPRLTYFSLTCFYGEAGIEALLNSLDLPSLCAFCFARSGLAIVSPRDGAWQSVLNLLVGTRRSPKLLPLRGLRFINAPATPAELKEILERAGGSIRYLALGGDACTDDLLEDFRPEMVAANEIAGSGTGLGSRTRPLCPKLETLEVLDVNVSLPSIISFASSRAAAVVSPGSNLPRSDSPVTEPEQSYRTLRRLKLLRDKFSHYFSDQHTNSSSLSSIKSYFPDGLDVTLL